MAWVAPLITSYKDTLDINTDMCLKGANSTKPETGAVYGWITFGKEGWLNGSGGGAGPRVTTFA